MVVPDPVAPIRVHRRGVFAENGVVRDLWEVVDTGRSRSPVGEMRVDRRSHPYSPDLPDELLGNALKMVRERERHLYSRWVCFYIDVFFEVLV